MKPTLTRKTFSQGFPALAKYLIAESSAHDIRISNCKATNVDGCISEVAAFGTEAATTHLILSYQPGHLPSNDQIYADEDAACEQCGMAGLQRISAIHRDTDNVHLHVAVSTIAQA